MIHFPLIRNLPPDDLDRDLSVDYEAVLAHVPHPEHHAHLLVPLTDDRLLAEYHSPRPERYGPLKREQVLGLR